MKEKKYIKFDNRILYFKDGSSEIELGAINTHKKALSKSQKLKAVANMGEWIEI